MNYGNLQEEYSQVDNAKVVIVPIPYDGTSTWMKGADQGPAALIEASGNMELYDIETDSEVYKLGIHTVSPVTEKQSPEKMTETVKATISNYLNKNKLVVAVGGEHSVTTGSVMAFAEKFNNLSVLQIDAHSDLRPEYEGSKYNHACVMSRVSELCPFVQVGIRSMDAEEKKYVTDKKKIFFADQIRNNTNWINEVVSQLSENVYITIDLDAFDPSIMPSTGTPEPGGLGWYEVIDLVKEVNRHKNLVGFDVVELCPNPDNKAPDFLAAKLIYKILSYKYFDKNY